MKPFKHQELALEQTWKYPSYFFMWEMRCGKTLPAAMTMVRNFNIGKIELTIVTAPSGLDLKWIKKDIPEIWPDSSIFEFDSSRTQQKKYKKAFDIWLQRKNKRWFVINVEALAFKKAQQVLDYLTSHFLCGLINDESQNFKNHKAKRTKAIMDFSRRCVIKRNLSGTPGDSPIDIWPQMYILKPNLLDRNFYAHRQRYCVFKRVKLKNPKKTRNGRLLLDFEQLVDYKDVDLLQRIIEPYCDRLTQKDLGMAKQTIKDVRIFRMTKEQTAVYKELKKDLITYLEDGTEITSMEAMVLAMRLQQITRGFVGDGNKIQHRIESDTTPILDVLLNDIDSISGKVVIWCNFKEEISMIVEALELHGIKCLRFDGSINKDIRPEITNKFRDDPEIKAIVSTYQTGGEGVDWSAADTMINYSHTYNFIKRKQANARIQGPMQKSDVLHVIDYICDDGLDTKCLNRMNEKTAVAAIITGDFLKEVLSGK